MGRASQERMAPTEPMAPMDITSRSLFPTPTWACYVSSREVVMAAAVALVARQALVDEVETEAMAVTVWVATANRMGWERVVQVVQQARVVQVAQPETADTVVMAAPVATW